MPYAIELYFESSAQNAIRTLWEAIAEAGISTYLVDKPDRPHISLGGCQQLNVTEYAPVLADFASSTKSFAVSMPNLGVFTSPNGVVFLGVTVTRPLLDIHENFHKQFADFEQDTMPLYKPGSWVPHVTIAFNIGAEKLSTTVALCQRTRLPLKGRIMEIGIVDTRTGEAKATYKLGM